MNNRFFTFSLRLPVFFFLHAVFVMIYGLYYIPIGILPSYALAAPFVSLFVVDEFIETKTLRIIAQFFVSAAWMFIASKVMASFTLVIIIISIMLLYFLVFSPYEYERYKFNNLLGLCFIIFFICYFANLDNYAAVFYVDGIIILIIRHVCEHIHKTRAFINSFACRGKSKKSISALIGRSNIFLVFSVVVIAVISALAFSLYRPREPFWPENAPKIVSEPISYSIIMPDRTFETPYPILEESVSGYEIIAEPILEPDFNLLKIIEAIVEIVVLILLIIVLVVKNYKKRVINTEFEDYDEEITEGYEFTIENKRKTRRSLLGSNAAVRRMYRSKVYEHRKRGLFITKSQTAKNISAEIGHTEDITELDAAYHKARYSGSEIDKSELAALKKK